MSSNASDPHQQQTSRRAAKVQFGRTGAYVEVTDQSLSSVVLLDIVESYLESFPPPSSTATTTPSAAADDGDNASAALSLQQRAYQLVSSGNAFITSLTTGQVVVTLPFEGLPTLADEYELVVHHQHHQQQQPHQQSNTDYHNGSSSISTNGAAVGNGDIDHDTSVSHRTTAGASNASNTTQAATSAADAAESELMQQLYELGAFSAAASSSSPSLLSSMIPPSLLASHHQRLQQEQQQEGETADDDSDRGDAINAIDRRDAIKKEGEEGEVDTSTSARTTDHHHRPSSTYHLNNNTAAAAAGDAVYRYGGGGDGSYWPSNAAMTHRLLQPKAFLQPSSSSTTAGGRSGGGGDAAASLPESAQDGAVSTSSAASVRSIPLPPPPPPQGAIVGLEDVGCHLYNRGVYNPFLHHRWLELVAKQSQQQQQSKASSSAVLPPMGAPHRPHRLSTTVPPRCNTALLTAVEADAAITRSLSLGSSASSSEAASSTPPSSSDLVVGGDWIVARWRFAATYNVEQPEEEQTTVFPNNSLEEVLFDAYIPTIKDSNTIATTSASTPLTSPTTPTGGANASAGGDVSDVLFEAMFPPPLHVLTSTSSSSISASLSASSRAPLLPVPLLDVYDVYDIDARMADRQHQLRGEEDPQQRVRGQKSARETSSYHGDETKVKVKEEDGEDGSSTGSKFLRRRRRVAPIYTAPHQNYTIPPLQLSSSS